MKFEWVIIHYIKSIGWTTYRAKVFGGWLVSNCFDDNNSMVFIPDQKHEWEVERD